MANSSGKAWGFGTPIKNEGDYLTSDEVEDFLSVVDNERDWLIFKLLFVWGCRIGELIGNRVRKCLNCAHEHHPNLNEYDETTKKWVVKYIRYCPKCGDTHYKKIRKHGFRPENIDLRDNVVYLMPEKRHMKNPKQLRKYTNIDLLNKVQSYITQNEISNNKIVFDLSRQRMEQVLKKYLARTNLSPDRGIHLHTFRHSAAIHLAKIAENPSDAKMIKDFLGHSSFATTEIYLDIVGTERKKLMKKAFG